VLGLAHIHARGFVHRDIKPSNILLCQGGIAKLADFGTIKEFKIVSSNKMSNLMAGTTMYFSRERLQGKPPSEASDVWALGIVYY
jgi:serine/threonine-protein kinase